MLEIKNLVVRYGDFTAVDDLSLTVESGTLFGFLGPNGAGKTNLLEAVHFLCLSKSFLTSSDSHVVRRGAPFFEIEGRFEGVHRSGLRVRLAYASAEGNHGSASFFIIQ